MKESRTAGGTIGLVGGLAVNAGVFYYRELAKRYAEANRPLDLLLAHADVRTVLAFIASGDRTGLARYLAGSIDRLAAGGCTAVAITAVAPHIAIEELRNLVSLPIVDMLAIIRTFVVEAMPYDRIAIFGTEAVMRTSIFGSIAPARVVTPPDATINRVHEIYSGIALAGKRGTENEYRALDEIATELREEGVEAVLLAGTDLSSFYSERPPQFPSVDLAQLHIDAIAAHRRPI